MSTPPIRYSGPVISPEVPWETRRHLQLIYQKLGNHTQAFGLIQQDVSAVQKAVQSGTGTASKSTSSSDGGSFSGGSTISNSLGVVNDQTAQSSYTTQQGDNGALIFVGSASPVAVSLASQTTPWFAWIANQGTATATLTPVSGTINYPGTSGATSMALAQGFAATVSFDGTDWWAIPFDVGGGGGGTGVASLNGETGALALTSSGGTVTITTPTSTTINLEATGAGSGVTSLNGETGSVSLVAGSNITITPGSPSAGDITIAASGGGGSTILSGSVTVHVSGGVGFYTGSGTVTGATTSMPAVACSPLGSSGLGPLAAALTATVTGTNTVEVGCWNLISGGSATFQIPVLVFA